MSFSFLGNYTLQHLRGKGDYFSGRTNPHLHVVSSGGHRLSEGQGRVPLHQLQVEGHHQAEIMMHLGRK